MSTSPHASTSRVALENGYILAQIVGDQNEETILQLFNEVNDLGRKHFRGDFNVLIDLSGTGRHDMGARQTGRKLLTAINTQRVALFGADLKLKTVVNLIITSARYGHKVRVFSKKPEAVEWLKGAS